MFCSILCIGDFLRSFRQREQQLLPSSLEILARSVPRWGRSASPGLSRRSQPFEATNCASQGPIFVVARPDRFEHRTVLRCFVLSRTLVHVLLLVADDPGSSWARVSKCIAKFVEAAQLLRLLENHHLVRTHHRHLPAEVHHLSRVGPAHRRSGWLKARSDSWRIVEASRSQKSVDEEGLLAHEQIDGRELFRPAISPRETVVGRHRIFEFYAAFRHGLNDLFGDAQHVFGLGREPVAVVDAPPDEPTISSRKAVRTAVPTPAAGLYGRSGSR